MTFKKGQSGNPKGRPPGSRHQERFKKVVTDEEFEAVTKAVLDAAKAGDMTACNLILSRMAPALKPIAEPSQIELPETGAVDQAVAILRAVAKGQIAAPQGKDLMDLVSGVAQFGVLTEIENRLSHLEKGNA